MTLTVVSPRDRERLVPLSPSIIVDARGETVAQAVVNEVVVWNGVTPLAGWMALTIPFPGGVRLVLDPPAPFTTAQVVNVVVGGSVTTSVSFLFQVGLRQITFTDDASVPRVAETSAAPWVVYSRVPGNVYARKDEPLTAEVLVVPGDKVDVGFNESTNEVEIVYIQNGKVFLVSGADDEVPSTLAQPSILKSNVKSGVTGESPNHRHDVVTFTPIKFATPIDGTLVSGFTGESPFITFSSPPNSPAPVAFLGTPAAAIVPPVSSTLITSVRLFKINTGAAVQVAELPYSTEIQVFLDPAYAEGDRYYTQSVYGDQGASAMRRLTARSADAGATNGDFLRAGFTGESPQHTHSTVTFAPLKLAVPTDGPVVSGYTGHSGEAGFTRTWFPAVGTAAAMSSAVGGHVLFTGLVQMSRQHLDRQITVSGAATAANNGSWTIVEIISATSVRVVALTAPGADANNGALVWSVTGADSVAPASFVARNTVNIGAGS